MPAVVCELDLKGSDEIWLEMASRTRGARGHRLHNVLMQRVHVVERLDHVLVRHVPVRVSRWVPVVPACTRKDLAAAPQKQEQQDHCDHRERGGGVRHHRRRRRPDLAGDERGADVPEKK